METKYTITHRNRAARVQETVNPLPPDDNTTVPEVSQQSTENRSHTEDGRLKG
jgi:hypothetical protein